MPRGEGFIDIERLEEALRVEVREELRQKGVRCNVKNVNCFDYKAFVGCSVGLMCVASSGEEALNELKTLAFLVTGGPHTIRIPYIGGKYFDVYVNIPLSREEAKQLIEKRAH